MLRRLIAIIFIYICTAIAWTILGSTVMIRTDTQDRRLKHEVGQLWGRAQSQVAPSVHYLTKQEVQSKRIEASNVVTEIETRDIKIPVTLAASQVQVDLDLEHRQKGLLWYSTYSVKFAGSYTVTNETDEEREFFVHFNFPAKDAIYDDFRFAVGGQQPNQLSMESGSIQHPVRLRPGQSETVEIGYRSQGLDQWWYDFGSNVTEVRDFSLTLDTNFKDIDFPTNSISPTSRTERDQGWSLEWRYTRLLAGVKIGIELPHKLNPGPWVSQVTFSAPISLFLFFFLLFMFSTLKDVKIHPMNYFFIAAGYFSFHLLLAYLVDHISIHVAFLLSSFVSIALIVSYARLVVGNRFAYLEVAISQFIYLVLFSYTFFFSGYTGLAITVLCILTLFVVMQFTGKVDWESLFQKKPRTSQASVNLSTGE